MKNIVLCILFICSFYSLQAQQSTVEKLQESIATLEKDPKLKHAILSITVLDAKTGKILFEQNSELGLPAASNQKVITSICAYELLDRNFRYETSFYLDSTKKNLDIEGSYDPTLGSWRYASTNPQTIIDSVLEALKRNHVSERLLGLTHNNALNDESTLSSAWIYEDLGNYYGAACSPINWRENKFELNLHATTLGKPTNFDSINPSFLKDKIQIVNGVVTDSLGVGDNTCTYMLPQNNKFVQYNYKIRGSLGAECKTNTIGLSMEGLDYLRHELMSASTFYFDNHYSDIKKKHAYLVYKHQSPSLDSITYWFLKKSVNLYGESLLRTMALKKYNSTDYRKGIQYIHEVCKKLLIDTASVHIFDGCGLSPQNRITSNALALFLQYARSKSYYKHFYNCLPVINNISMKSGSIHGVRAYSGYVSSADQHEYTFSIIVNNYDGSGKEMQTKLWKILDALK